jgi:hypothetical protein
VTFAGIFEGAITVLEWLLALGWAYRLVEWLRCSPQVADITRGPFAAVAEPSETGHPEEGGEAAPDLSVIVPACNEAAAIAGTLRSLLASRGVRMQVIAVNDRSTDETGAIMRAVEAEWAARVDRDLKHSLEVIDIVSLPEGWLGKPHALATGAGRARALWLLFTDGDVFFAPEAAARALGCAVKRRAGQLALMPDLVLGSPGEAAMHGMMYSLSLWGFQAWNVENVKSKAFLGVGAFNLMHRSTYETVGGFEALRLEVLEDMRLGWKVKRAGLRPVAAFGPGLVSVRWAQGAWGVVRNTEKNLFALYRFRTGLALAASFALALHVLVPEAALLVGGPWAWWARAALAVHGIALVGLYGATRRVTHVPVGYVLLFPFALGLFVFAHLRSVTLALVRGGILWRGTFYPLRLLREHAGNWR